MTGPLGGGSRVGATGKTRALRLVLELSIKAVLFLALLTAATALNPTAPWWAVLVHSIITWLLAQLPVDRELRRRQEISPPRRQAEKTGSDDEPSPT